MWCEASGTCSALASAKQAVLFLRLPPEWSGWQCRWFGLPRMKQCLVLLLRQHLDRQSTASPLFAALQDGRLARAVAAVVEPLGAHHSLVDLAALAGMSRSSFSERFSRTFSQSPLDFVLTVRLRHAAHLLSATELPAKLVSDAVGYASRSHFSRAFKFAYGTDPSAYRTVGRSGRP